MPPQAMRKTSFAIKNFDMYRRKKGWLFTQPSQNEKKKNV